MSIIDVRGSNSSVWDYVLTHNLFEVSLRWVVNHYLVSVSEFGPVNIFPSEPFKNFPDSFYEGRILGFVGVSVWYTYFILVELDLPILGLDNVISFPAVIGDWEPHIFKFWGAEDVSNTFLVETTRNETEGLLLVSGCDVF